MKKLFIYLLILLLANTNVSFANTNFQPDPAEMKARQKAKLMADIKLTDAQADSVVNISMEFMPKLRGMRGLQPEERMAKLKEINDGMKARLTAALKDEKLVNTVLEYQEKQRKERMEQMRAMRPQE